MASELTNRGYVMKPPLKSQERMGCGELMCLVNVCRLGDCGMLRRGQGSSMPFPILCLPHLFHLTPPELKPLIINQ